MSQDWCARCGHSPAYHADPARPCHAWDPDREDHMCACEGFKEKPAPAPTPAPAPAPAPAEVDLEEQATEVPW